MWENSNTFWSHLKPASFCSAWQWLAEEDFIVRYCEVMAEKYIIYIASVWHAIKWTVVGWCRTKHRNLSEVIFQSIWNFFFSFWQEDGTHYFFSLLQSAYFIHAQCPVKPQGRPVRRSEAECCILAAFVAPSIMPSSTTERPRLAEGQTLTHSDEFIVV